MAHFTAPADSIQWLYREHHSWLRQWLQYRLGCSETAADLAQDTFVRLLTWPQRFDRCGARAYLSTIANGLVIDLWRRRQIERAWLETLAVSPQPLEPSPEYRALLLEALCAVDALLRRLPLRPRQAFVMAQVHGMKYQEIAVKLGVSERMIKKYMAQAMLHCAMHDAGLSEF